jgi:hypothetical protein
MGLKDFFNKAMGTMGKQMAQDLKKFSDEQLRQLAAKGNTYAAEELRRRGK